MSDSDRTYFLVSARSPVREVIAAVKTKHEKYQEACEAFAGDFGAKEWVRTTAFSVHLLGLVFKGAVPEGWRTHKNKPYARPDGKTKLGRDIKKRMAELPSDVSGAWFSDALQEKVPNKGKYEYFDGLTLSWSVVEKFGPHYILSVPSACKAHPGGCKELKMSEYWKLRESAEGKRKH